MKRKLLVYIIYSIASVSLLSGCGSTGEVVKTPPETSAVAAADTQKEDLIETGDSEEEPQGSVSDKPDIVWIGDSLTQGSTGEDNHNENNPQAPWRIHGEISGLNVAGAGFYGYHTHDIFWAYEEYNGLIDPDVTYVYWVGSNDCHDSPNDVKYVIEETDRFNERAGITRFIMLGTTNRGDMPEGSCDIFNKALSDHYGDKYLDILPYVEFGPDGVHLTEESYAAVASAVNDKLKAMGF